ncbi:MAG: helix-turn-helix domain-containing protein [Thermoleophilaceae bacterium]
MQDVASEIARHPHGRVPRALRERQIFELGEELFAERGYAGASMDELARRAGVSKPVIYDLAGSKEELYRACVSRAAQELYERVEAAVIAAPDAAAKARAGGLAFFSFVAEHRRSWEVLFMGDPGRFAADAARIRGRQAELQLRLIGDPDVGLGMQVDPQQADAMVHAVNGAYEALANWWYAHPEVSPEMLVDWLMALILPGIERIASGR